MAAIQNNQLPDLLVRCYAESLIEGNEVYGQLVEQQKLTHVNLNIPEAMEAAKHKLANIMEWVFVFLFCENPRIKRI